LRFKLRAWPSCGSLKVLNRVKTMA